MQTSESPGEPSHIGEDLSKDESAGLEGLDDFDTLSQVGAKTDCLEAGQAQVQR